MLTSLFNYPAFLMMAALFVDVAGACFTFESIILDLVEITVGFLRCDSVFYLGFV